MAHPKRQHNTRDDDDRMQEEESRRGKVTQGKDSMIMIQEDYVGMEWNGLWLWLWQWYEGKDLGSESHSMLFFIPCIPVFNSFYPPFLLFHTLDHISTPTHLPVHRSISLYQHSTAREKKIGGEASRQPFLSYNTHHANGWTMYWEAIYFRILFVLFYFLLHSITYGWHADTTTCSICCIILYTHTHTRVYGRSVWNISDKQRKITDVWSTRKGDTTTTTTTTTKITLLFDSGMHHLFIKCADSTVAFFDG